MTMLAPDPMQENPDNTFGRWLDMMLRSRGWTRAELGRRIGTDGSLVSKWVYGRQRPDSASCRAIADAFGISTREVMIQAGHADPEGLPPGDPVKERMRDLVDLLPSHLLAPFIGVFEQLMEPSKQHEDHKR